MTCPVCGFHAHCRSAVPILPGGRPGTNPGGGHSCAAACGLPIPITQNAIAYPEKKSSHEDPAPGPARSGTW